jgi:hypothetical protein
MTNTQEIWNATWFIRVTLKRRIHALENMVYLAYSSFNVVFLVPFIPQKNKKNNVLLLLLLTLRGNVNLTEMSQRK